MRYEVTRAWHGVSVGDVVELKHLHPSLKPNVRPLGGDSVLEAATPAASSEVEQKRRGRPPKTE
ncbi:glycoprotein [Pseudomonas aeruginosa]|uniref:glycoprotein n=1 Tax=Pseudomonas aeruginosa TaxID=287 RepID=UPI001E13D3E6|nr:glycoprotein [Pseudomonas aeruginosa]MBX5791984.1 glycoprotein [Pseudomonas aeruginosa]HBP6576228.1 glycoprotein [Pseudomonas aeruginosa]